ncbi:MAG: PEP-CTERM system TPR-repeat protein PrsT [Oxalobacteraceae bacterium]|nr:MAG: PEP-CTERM system TPR-repeat protein PrsT [Oxalobacteraceae bacterium]
MHQKFCARPTLTLVCLALSLAACSPKTEKDLLASSEKFVTKGDTPAALIELKNALQQYPNSTRARLMLAQQLIVAQDFRSAEIELRKLLEQKYDAKVILPLLARSVLENKGPTAALKEFKTLKTGSAQADAAILTQMARAEQQLGQLPQAESTLTEALTLNSADPAARTLMARLTSGRAPDQALATVADVIRTDPAQQDAWLLMGDVKLYMKRDIPGAIEAYEKVVSLRKDHVLAYAALMSIRLMQKDAKATEELLARFKKAAPKHPQQHYYQAQLLAMKGDIKGARESIQKLLIAVPSSAKGQLLAGSLALQAGDLLQAQKSLGKALQLDPDMPDARRLMAQLLIRMGRPERALVMLQPLIETNAPDSTTLAIAAQAHLQMGAATQAEALYAQAAKLAPNDLNIRTSLATTQLERSANAEAALTELRDIAATDKDIVADLALVTAQMNRKNFDAALAAVDGIERKRPKQPEPLELRGRVNLARNDASAARANFEKALAVDPKFYPAVLALAKLDLLEKRPKEAMNRFEKLLAADPTNVPAMLAIAEQRTQRGENTAEIAALIDKAIKLSPEDPKPRELMIALLLATKDVKTALTTAQTAVAAIPSNPDLFDLLGRTEMETGAYNQAIASFNKVAALQPKSAIPAIRVADVYQLMGQPKPAIASLKRATELAPDMVLPRQNLIALLRQTGQQTEALANARALQRISPKSPLGFLFEGDVLMEQKSFDAAVKSYRMATTLTDAPPAPARVHTGLIYGKRSAEADKFAKDWLSAHPRDTSFMQYLGDFWLSAGQPAAAAALYDGILKISPKDSLALNNLAWALMYQKKRPEALDAAQRAAQLSPGSPAVLETWASALAETGDLKQAVEVAQRSHQMAPDQPLLELSLARILLQAGQKEEAAKHLNKLQKLGSRFPQQPKVLEMIRSLGKP